MSLKKTMLILCMLLMGLGMAFAAEPEPKPVAPQQKPVDKAAPTNDSQPVPFPRLEFDEKAAAQAAPQPTPEELDEAYREVWFFLARHYYNRDKLKNWPQELEKRLGK